MKNLEGTSSNGKRTVMDKSTRYVIRRKADGALLSNKEDLAFIKINCEAEQEAWWLGLIEDFEDPREAQNYLASIQAEDSEVVGVTISRESFVPIFAYVP